MTDETTSSSNSRRLARSARRWRPWLIGLASLIVIQSITITLPIHGRVVDETSGQPVAGAAIAALWQLDTWTPVHGLPGGAVRTAQAVTGKDGTFEFPTALIVHPPLLPLSWLMRSESNMPELVVVADGYQPLGAANDVFGIDGPRHASGFLFVRISSLQGAVLRLVSLPQAMDARQRDEYRGTLDAVAHQIAFAADSCEVRSYCQSHSLAEVMSAIERGIARARFGQRVAPQRREEAR
jgi:hypothetical protein